MKATYDNPEEYSESTKRIAKRLIEIESETPGSVRVRANPLHCDGVAEKFKRMGFKKRLFQSAEQFNIDCFLSYVPAAESILHRVLLDGPTDHESHIHCWDGVGRYMGWQGLNQLSDWRNPQISGCVFLVYVRPFFDRISDLLEPIKPLEALSSGNQNTQKAPTSRQELTYKLMISVLGDEDANRAIKELNLSPEQKQRISFSTLVFPFILLVTLATLNGRDDLNQILPDPFDVSWPDKDEPIRIGDIVIQENEYQSMAEFLETKYRQKVMIQDVPNYKIDYGTLFSGISMIRSRQQIADWKEIIRVYAGEKQHFALISQLGIRLESYVCEDVARSRQSDQNNLARSAVFGRIAGAYFKKVYQIFKML